MLAGIGSDQVRSLARPACTSFNSYRLCNGYLRKRSMGVPGVTLAPSIVKVVVPNCGMAVKETLVVFNTE